MPFYVIKQLQIYFYAQVIILWNFYTSTYPNAQQQGGTFKELEFYAMVLKEGLKPLLFLFL